MLHPPSPMITHQQMPSHPDHNMLLDQEMSDDMEDERMKAEKDILNTHLEAVREEAQLI